ncbi:MAG: tRNA (adenosine(37)-N6)-threonylcarbamoyltransferase complex ATPase subunit type 1 TsaE [Solirubrobacteraceae bacterium]
MTVTVLESSESAETEAIGAELAGRLRVGDVVLVRGDLGSGKTTFVRGAARALGVKDPITSPTFSIGHRYRGDGVIVSHIDLYRLAGLEGEDPALLADHLGPGTIAFVEWPEAAGSELGNRRFEVTLAHAGGDRRRVEVRELRRAAARDRQRPHGHGAIAGTGLGLDGAMGFASPAESQESETR